MSTLQDSFKTQLLTTKAINRKLYNSVIATPPVAIISPNTPKIAQLLKPLKAPEKGAPQSPIITYV